MTALERLPQRVILMAKPKNLVFSETIRLRAELLHSVQQDT